MDGMSVHKETFILWISQQLKCMSFKQVPGFQEMSYSSHEEMWSAVHNYVDIGYKVQ